MLVPVWPDEDRSSLLSIESGRAGNVVAVDGYKCGAALHLGDHAANRPIVRLLGYKGSAVISYVHLVESTKDQAADRRSILGRGHSDANRRLHNPSLPTHVRAQGEPLGVIGV